MIPFSNNRQLPTEHPLFFDDFITRNSWKAGRQQSLQINQLPAINVYETEQVFVIELTAPGLAQEDLLFLTTENSIEISYTPDENSFEPYGSRRYLHREYRPRPFQRTFQLNPEALDLEALRVDASNGVVRLELPKRAEFQGVLALQVPFSLN